MARRQAKSRSRDRQGRIAPSDSPEKKLLRELRSEFIADYKHNKTWLASKSEEEDFYDGHQWTQEEIDDLAERNQAPVVINRVKPKIDSICGMQMEIAVDTKAFPKGIRDFEKAKHMSTALRHIEQENDFDSEESDVFEDVLRAGGRGWYKTFIEWDELDPSIRTVRLENDDVIPDRHGRKADLSDHKRVHETIWMNLDDAKEMFPDFERELEAAFLEKKTMGGALERGTRRRPDQYDGSPNEEPGIEAEDMGAFVNKTAREIRVICTQYRVPYMKRLLFVPGEGIMDVSDESPEDVEQFVESFEGAESFSQLCYHLHQATYTVNAMLEHKKNIAPWDKDAQFWYTLAEGYKDKRKKIHYGLTRQMIWPSKELNKRRSKSIHLLSVNQIIREPGAVEDPEQARIEANKPDGEIVKNPGGYYEIVRQTDLGMGQIQMLQEAKQELDQAGVPREMEGISNAKSGRDFQLRQRSQIAAIRKLFRNLRKARRQVGQLWIKMIQHYWTDEMALKVSDDPDSPVMLLNQPVIDPETKEIMTDEAGNPVKENDLSVGKYDLIVEESAEYINLESETFDTLAQLAMKGVPIPPEMLIENAPLPNRQKWLDRMREQQAAQAQAQQVAAVAAGEVDPALMQEAMQAAGVA